MGAAPASSHSMRFSALLWLAALAGALVSAGEYDPPPAAPRSPDPPGLTSRLRSSLFLPAGCWLPLPQRGTDPCPQLSTRRPFTPGWGPRSPLAVPSLPVHLFTRRPLPTVLRPWPSCGASGPRTQLGGLSPCTRAPGREQRGPESSPYSVCPWPWVSGCLFRRRVRKALFRPGRPCCSSNPGTFLLALASAWKSFPVPVPSPQPTPSVTGPMLSHPSHVSVDGNSSRKAFHANVGKLRPLITPLCACPSGAITL